jgi:peptidoglycan/xylan/chitin deacetylase (PgdA/CDA1 family)
VIKLFLSLLLAVFASFNSQISCASNAQESINSSAVILQYHHVSTTTPQSTSISPDKFKDHIHWIKDNNFQVLALPELIKTLKNNRYFSRDKVIAITFDDANSSVCDIAWPILEKHQLPFTLFISTEAIEKGYQSQCSWSQLRDMATSGLMTPANHSHQHLNMISSEISSGSSNWKQAMREDILKAQTLIEDKVGNASRLFAYPFGEYNAALATLVTELGFTGFGQHSGAIGHQSDFSALPRFPASGQFADLDTLATKLLSLAFPAKFLASTDNPIQIDSADNPPILTLIFSDNSLLNSTRCYNSAGQALPIQIDDTKLIVAANNKLDSGRHRYTCTSKSNIDKRFYWLSHQWLIEDTKGYSLGSMLQNLFK